jgi:hypothetical protein
MDTNTIKNVMYGGITHLMKDRDLYYSSGVGVEYNRWTDKGKEALAEYMNILSGQIIKAESLELDQRAKNLVINGLKGD